MKKLFILFILVIQSCSLLQDNNGIEVTIKNNSKHPITDIQCYTSEKLETLQIPNIEANKTVSKFLSMKKNKQDGNYILEYVDANKKKRIKKEGYYTNGSSLNKWITFSIEKDTILVTYSKPSLIY
ncbi:hypothetical protein ACFSSB_07540 [Lacinutrix gracilariae]|uniref:Lipoprotein n=1 Tax=Lacinutrix gracilariae TaxID=1747198 RepID=A0ABW5K2U3_9FLAO